LVKINEDGEIMKRLVNLFTEHPRSIGETYAEHFVIAAGLSFKLGVASMMQCIHALLPFFAPPFNSDVASLRKSLEEFDPNFRRR
tara:strand:- start:464 stop:718 length:255 start_codon:yes stop_codon:yes gene_type:complete